MKSQQGEVTMVMRRLVCLATFALLLGGASPASAHWVQRQDPAILVAARAIGPARVPWVLKIVRVPKSVWEAIAQEAHVACNTTTTAATTTASCALTIPSASNLFLACWSISNENVDAGTAAAVWNSTENLMLSKESGTTARWSNFLTLVNPTPGSFNVDFSGLSANVQDAMECVVWSGVDQSTPFDTLASYQQTASASTHTGSATPSDSGDLVVAIVSGSTQHANISNNGASNFTKQNGSNTGSVNASVSYYTAPGTGASETQPWQATAAIAWSSLTFNLNAAGGGGGGAACGTAGAPPKGTLATLGVGC